MGYYSSNMDQVRHEFDQRQAALNLALSRHQDHQRVSGESFTDEQVAQTAALFLDVFENGVRPVTGNADLDVELAAAPAEGVISSKRR